MSRRIEVTEGEVRGYFADVLHSQVTPEDLDKRAKELGVLSIETSAKAGHNVKALFKKIAMALPGGAEAKDAAANQSTPAVPS